MSFFMSVGRHEAYERHGAKYPITPSGIADAWLSGPILEEQSAPVDVIYASPLPRARATAVVRGMSIGCLNIIISEALHENAAPSDVLQFQKQALSEAESAGIKHIHFVTHQPVVATLGGSFSITPGAVFVQKAENWRDIMLRRAETMSLPPVEKQLYALQFEKPEVFDRMAARYAGLTALAQKHEGSLESLLSAYAASEPKMIAAQRFSGRSR